VKKYRVLPVSRWCWSSSPPPLWAPSPRRTPARRRAAPRGRAAAAASSWRPGDAPRGPGLELRGPGLELQLVCARTASLPRSSTVVHSARSCVKRKEEKNEVPGSPKKRNCARAQPLQQAASLRLVRSPRPESSALVPAWASLYIPAAPVVGLLPGAHVEVTWPSVCASCKRCASPDGVHLDVVTLKSLNNPAGELTGLTGLWWRRRYRSWCIHVCSLLVGDSVTAE